MGNSYCFILGFRGKNLFTLFELPSSAETAFVNIINYFAITISWLHQVYHRTTSPKYHFLFPQVQSGMIC